jgi:hypothetical protein
MCYHARSLAEEVLRAMPHPRLSGEEIERRGQALYEQSIRSKVGAGHDGKICMIDVESGDYEIGDTMPFAKIG